MADAKKTATPSEDPPEIEAELPLPVLVPSAKESEKTRVGKNDPKKPSMDTSRLQRFRNWYVSHKKWSIPLSALVFLLLLLVVPFTRYPVAGLVLKKNFVVQVNDSTTNTPVSGATVSSGTLSVQTSGSGKASLRLSAGHHSINISKKYYQDRKAEVLVPIVVRKNTPVISFQATGRQVKVSVNNAISKDALANVDIKVADVNAKTDKDGNALVVLPAGTAAQKATLSLSGYNNADVIVKVSDSTVAENKYTIVPVGKVYFLSKQSGKIDVVKSNLDGSKRETVLAGTGREDDKNTVLLASRDWKYLALLSRRDSDLAKLYLIETSSDKVTAIDEGNATFSLIGWSDANFIYQVDRQGYQLWQPKQHALKGYSAVDKKVNLFDESDAQGSSNFDANYENFSSTFIVGQRLVYTKSWYANFSGSSDLEDNSLGIYSVNVNGSGGRSTHKTYGYATGTSTYEQSFLYKPDQIYYEVIEKNGDAKYLVYANNQVSEKSSIKNEFTEYLNGAQHNTYLQSPSSNATFWSEPRDGKNTLFVGDSFGIGTKQVASLSDYQTYGWYSDSYLLASKNGSELYIFGSNGIKKDSDALKITDYHKPLVNYPGYGGGYGGI